MTKEELLKAMEDGTWLVWRTSRLNRAPDDELYDELCRVIQVWFDHPEVLCDVRTVDHFLGHDETAYVKELRIATPNDMLKYGK